MTTISLAAALGRAVRRLRMRPPSPYAQEAFADHVGLHRTAQSILERGLTDPKLSTLERLAAGLGLSTSELLREAERELEAP